MNTQLTIPKGQFDEVMTAIEELSKTYPKETLIANTWMVAPGLKYQHAARLFDASNEHARRTYRELETYDEKIQSEADEELQHELIDLLKQTGLVDELGYPVTVRTSPDDIPGEWRDTDQETANESELPGVAKNRIRAAWQIANVAGEQVTNRDLSTVAECSEEHARRTRNEIERGDTPPEAFADIPQAVWDAVAKRMNADAQLVEQAISSLPPDTDTPPQPQPANQVPAIDLEDVEEVDVREVEVAEDAMVPATEVKQIRTVMDTLRREANTTNAVKAEFVAEEAVRRLNALLHDAES